MINSKNAGKKIFSAIAFLSCTCHHIYMWDFAVPRQEVVMLPFQENSICFGLAGRILQCRLQGIGRARHVRSIVGGLGTQQSTYVVRVDLDS